MCAVICRKVTLTLPDANFLFARAQNCHFCALLHFGAPIFGSFKHKKGFFVSERATFSRFCPLPSTKLRFLCSGCCNRGDAYVKYSIGKSNKKEGNL